MTPTLILNKSIKYSFLLAFLFIISLTIWGIDKGFDITDEGYYIFNKVLTVNNFLNSTSKCNSRTGCERSGAGIHLVRLIIPIMDF